MNHDRWLERLSSYLDGDLSPADCSGMESHLAECAECGAAAADLRRLLAAAKELPPTSPPRDLWPTIASRLDEPPAIRSLPQARARSRHRLVLTWPQAIAAAATIAVVAGIGAAWWRHPVADLPASGEAPETAATESLASSSDAAYLALGAEIQALRHRLEQEGQRLDPETARVLDKNLRLIEQAIGESRVVLASDAGRASDGEAFVASLSGKLELLRQATDVALSQADGG